MTTWRVARVTSTCGNCGSLIDVGDTYLEVHVAANALPKVRCQTCGERLFGQPASAVTTDDRESEQTSVPAGIRYQPSMGFERGRE